MIWWAVLAIAAIFLGHGHLLPSAGFFAVGGIVCYLVSIARHPRRACRACNGTGRTRGTMFWWSRGVCTTCGSSGVHRRWGTQVLYGKPGVRAANEQGAKDAGRRRGAPR